MTQKNTFDMSTLLNMRVKQCEFYELLLKQTTIFFRIKRQTYTRT